MNTDRRTFLKTVGTVVAGTALSLESIGKAPASVSAETDKPRRNILFIMSDQQRADALSCAGNPVVKTPHIDSIAESGVRFTNGYVQCPQCMPSRASLLNGRYPSVHRVRYNRTAYLEYEEPNTIGNVLKRQGYKTGCFGKMHIQSNTSFNLGFGDSPEDNFETGDYGKFINEKIGKNPINEGMKQPHWTGKMECAAELSHESVCTDKTIEFMEKNQYEPFLIWLSYYGPHPPYTAPDPYYEMYPRDEMPLPPKPPEGIEDDFGKVHASLVKSKKNSDMTDDDWRYLYSQYYGLCAHIDDCVARALEKLDELGLAESTMVVYTADHGDIFGEHGGMFSKGRFMFDATTKVPFIVRIPGVTKPGTVCEALVQSIDLVPTMMEWAGAEIPPGVQGKSLMPLLRGEKEQIHDAVFCEGGPGSHDRMNMMRTKKYKYVYYTNKGEELFDMENDPGEFANLALRAEHKDLLADMRLKMLDGKIKNEDPLPVLEPSNKKKKTKAEGKR